MEYSSEIIHVDACALAYSVIKLMLMSLRRAHIVNIETFQKDCHKVVNMISNLYVYLTSVSLKKSQADAWQTKSLPSVGFSSKLRSQNVLVNPIIISFYHNK